MAASILTRLADVEEEIDQVTEQLSTDRSASPAFKAVFDELHRKACEARGTLSGAEEPVIREQIIEVEQAADSAKLAAEADDTLATPVRDAVVGIHDTLSELKKEIVG